MADEAKSALTIDVTGSVALVTFDRPHRRNAIDIDTIHELGAFLEKADRDATIRAIVLAGSARDYCTGADMTANPKLGRSAALQRSMLALIDRGGRFAHPVNWAPFVVVGEGAR